MDGNGIVWGHMVYPLVNIQKTKENHHVEWVTTPIKDYYVEHHHVEWLAIQNTYVSIN